MPASVGKKYSGYPLSPYHMATIRIFGGWAGAVVAGKLDPRDPTAALGFANAVKDLPQKTTAGGMLYVFALPR